MGYSQGQQNRKDIPDSHSPPDGTVDTLLETALANFSIRLATLADVNQVQELIEISVRELQSCDYTAAQIQGALGHTFGVDTQLMEDGTYFVAHPAHDSGLIVACGGWSFRKTLFGSDNGPDRQAALLDPATEPAKIRAIFVHPRWARQGLGSMMLRHCEAAASAAGFRAFEMGSTLTGEKLYSLRGYRPTERLGVPLPNGEVLPITVMRKSAPQIEQVPSR